VLVDEKANIREFNRSFAAIYKEESGNDPEVGASFFNVAGTSERAAISTDRGSNDVARREAL